MYEIEVKARVVDKNEIELKLSDLGCVLGAAETQDDYIYLRKGFTPALAKSSGEPVLRIRVTDSRTMFTLKQNRSGELDCLEKEIEISSEDKMIDILEILGFCKVVEVHKSRRKGKMNGYEICLDEVKGLGSFIEVEKMSEEDGKTVQKELIEFLKSVGVKEEFQVFSGYDTLVYETNK